MEWARNLTYRINCYKTKVESSLVVTSTVNSHLVVISNPIARNVIRSVFNTKIPVLSLLVCTSIFLRGQSSSPIGYDSPSLPTTIGYGFDKIANTFIFKSDALTRLSLGNFDLGYEHRYRGSAVRSLTGVFRDDLDVTLRAGKFFQDIARFDVETVYSTLRDSRSIGLSDNNRFRTVLSAKRSFDSSLDVQATLGTENSRQLGFPLSGILYGVQATAQPLSGDQDSVSFRSLVAGNFEQADFKQGFSTRNSGLNASLDRFTDSENSLHFEVNYVDQLRSFYSVLPLSNRMTVERRAKNAVSFVADVRFKTGDALGFFLNTAITTGTIDRSFRDGDQANPMTGVLRVLTESDVNSTLGSYLNWNSTRLQLGVSFSLRSEQNGIRTLSRIAQFQEDSLRQIESQRDFNAARLRLFSENLVWYRVNDTLRLNAAIGIQRYDTPSNLNGNDRDEQTLMLELEYKRTMTSNLKWSVVLRNSNTHLVNLGSQLSGQNNWFRVLKFAPSVWMKTSFVEANPSLEVSANYTVYDFANRLGTLRSISFRQLSYRDSITVPINHSYHFAFNIFSRVFEIGRLNWSDFSERVETHNYERLIRGSIVQVLSNEANLEHFSVRQMSSPTWLFAIGFRYYTLVQQPYSVSSSSPVASGTSIESLAPEIVVRWGSESSKSISFSGWYEFQVINATTTRHLPNVFLTARYPL